MRFLSRIIGVAAVVLLATRRASRADTLPLVPFLTAATLLVVVA